MQHRRRASRLERHPNIKVIVQRQRHKTPHQPRPTGHISPPQRKNCSAACSASTPPATPLRRAYAVRTRHYSSGARSRAGQYGHSSIFFLHRQRSKVIQAIPLPTPTGEKQATPAKARNRFLARFFFGAFVVFLLHSHAAFAPPFSPAFSSPHNSPMCVWQHPFVRRRHSLAVQSIVYTTMVFSMSV